MVRISHLSKSFGDNAVIRDLTLTLPDGGVTVLVGPSGSGKTTLANLLLGLLPPDGGAIEGIAGKRLAAVFQEDRLCEQMSATGNVRLVLGTPTTAASAGIRRELLAVGLDEESVTKPVSQLSGGQRRRVAIVRAMMATSDFLCLDEPFKGLDEATKERTMTYVSERIVGKTVLLITHDPAEAARFEGTRVSL